ncbi:MAG: ATP-binding protein [Opitutales bacterium]
MTTTGFSDSSPIPGSLETHEDALLRESRQRLEVLVSALDAAANTVLITGRNGIIEWVNQAFTEVTGYTPDDAVGQTPGALLNSGVHSKEFFQRMWATILAGRVWTGEFINRRKDGSLFAEPATITPVKDARGEIHHFIAIAARRHRIDEELFGKRVRHQQRLESIGTLAGGIAHDLNNALTPALLSVNLLRGFIANESQIALLNNIETSLERSAGMVEQVVAFARGIEGERTILSPRSLLRDIEKFVQDTFPKNITLNVRAPGDLWSIFGDPAQLHQLLLNLCLNASEAMPSGGTLSIALDNVQLSSFEKPEANEGHPGLFVKITVADSGIGIPTHIVERIFDPFFTTKEVGKGSGLGLSIAYSIAKSHEGFVQAESTPEEGARFEVFLPANRENPGISSSGDQASGLSKCRGETILVVDDEELLLDTLCALLETAGYKVIRSRNGAEAVELFTRYSNDIDLVLIDLVMPGMNGVSAIEAMCEIKPSTRAIVATGQRSSGKAHRVFRHSISKPYSQAEVLSAIRTVLDENE